MVALGVRTDLRWDAAAGKWGSAATWAPRTRSLREELRQLDALLRGRSASAIRSVTTHPTHWSPPPAQAPKRRFRLRRKHEIVLHFDPEREPNVVEIVHGRGHLLTLQVL